MTFNRKKYYQKNKEKIKIRGSKWYQKNKIKCNKKNLEYKKRINYKYTKKWRINNRDKENLRHNNYVSKRIKKDKNFAILHRLRIYFYNALKKYTLEGKYQKAKTYGINYEKIIDYLKPFPKNIKEYHIDHIKPLCSFDLENPDEIKQAFAPENHQWLLVKDNLSKGGNFNDN